MRIKSVVLVLIFCSTLPIAVVADQAVFAGGCFWCMEAEYQELDGVTSVVSGFTGGTLQNPTYKGDHSGHYEAVLVDYDPDQISYAQLLDIYWKNIDPFDARGQFCDKGESYRAAIFVADTEQRQLAEASFERVEAQFPDRQVVTEILPTGQFWPVEDYHQDYYLKNRIRYKFYRSRCGRDQRLAEIWGEDE